MCGINGIVSFNSSENLSAIVKVMNDALAHRGPDDEGVFSEQGIALGHRRLSIIDLSAAGHQPMISRSGNLITVFNGEIYNFREIKNELDDPSLQTDSDTTVLLAAWEKWGEACLSRLNGMFAFAIWDKLKKQMFIVRDRLGIKPVYYSGNHNQLLFSSEVRGLLASGKVERKIDQSSLHEYVRYQTVHAPRTILSDVKMLLPGSLLQIDTHGVVERRWWKPQVKIEDTAQSYTNVCKQTRALFKAAVERRLVADVPFGAFLSGGIDSTAVTGMMTEVSGTRIKTFNVAFDRSEFSEAVYARSIAKKFNTDHHEIVLTPQHFLEQLPAALDAMDHPSGDGPNTYVVSKATKNAGITMALSGLGGDELFAGYDIFKRAFSLQQKKWIFNVPRFARSAGGKLLKSLKPGISSEKIAEVLALDKVDFPSYYPLSREVLNSSVASRLVGESGRAKFPASSDIYGELSYPEATHFLSTVSLAEMTSYMQNILLRDADQMSMAHALEVRVPFLDYELVNYVLNVPDRMKYPSTPKKLLVDSLNDLLPAEIVNRPKMGFTFPWKEWMKTELRDFCVNSLEYLSQNQIINGSELMTLWNRFLADDPNITWSRVWHLVVLGHWMKKNGVTR